MIPSANIIIESKSKPICNLPEMSFGNMPNDGGFLLLNYSEADDAINKHNVNSCFILPFIGSQEFIKGTQRRCIWVKDNDYEEAKS